MFITKYTASWGQDLREVAPLVGALDVITLLNPPPHTHTQEQFLDKRKLHETVQLL